MSITTQAQQRFLADQPVIRMKSSKNGNPEWFYPDTIVDRQMLNLLKAKTAGRMDDILASVSEQCEKFGVFAWIETTEELAPKG